MLFLWLRLQDSHVLQTRDVVCSDYFVSFLGVNSKLDIAVKDEGGTIVCKVTLILLIFTVLFDYFKLAFPVPHKAKHTFFVLNNCKLPKDLTISLAKRL